MALEALYGKSTIEKTVFKHLQLLVKHITYITMEKVEDSSNGKAMIGKNRQLVTDEPVEFEK